MNAFSASRSSQLIRIQRLISELQKIHLKTSSRGVSYRETPRQDYLEMVLPYRGQACLMDQCAH